MIGAESFLLAYLVTGALIGVYAPDPSSLFVMVALAALMGVACVVVLTFEKLTNRE